MQPKIEQARDQKVVYWRAIGEYGPHGEIGQIWQNVYQWASARAFSTARIGPCTGYP
jgi:hypothetical protein